MDRNRDQRIDESEAQSDPNLIAAWADIDVTRDGSVDATEYYLFAAQRTIAELESGSAASPQASEQSGSAGQQGQSQQQQEQVSRQQSNTGREAGGESEPSPGQQQSDLGQRSASEPLPTEQQGSQSQRSASDRSSQQGETESDLRADQGRSSSQYPAFEELDTTGDGVIDRVELASLEGVDFSSADSDQNGALSQEEYRQATME